MCPLDTLLARPASACDTGYRLSKNERALNGWVEQHSPCCAAASIAGAFNALRGVSSSDEAATPASQVLGYLQAQVTAELAEKRAATVAPLCLPDVASMPAAIGLFLSCLELMMSRRGRPLTGRKAEAVGNRELRAALREVAFLIPEAADALRDAKELRDSHAAATGSTASNGMSDWAESVLWSRLRMVYEGIGGIGHGGGASTNRGTAHTATNGAEPKTAAHPTLAKDGGGGSASSGTGGAECAESSAGSGAGSLSACVLRDEGLRKASTAPPSSFAERLVAPLQAFCIACLVPPRMA